MSARRIDPDPCEGQRETRESIKRRAEELANERIDQETNKSTTNLTKGTSSSANNVAATEIHWSWTSTVAAQPVGEVDPQIPKVRFVETSGGGCKLKSFATIGERSGSLRIEQFEEPYLDVAKEQLWLDSLQIHPRGHIQRTVAYGSFVSISWREAKRRHGEIATAHLAALFGNLEYCRKLARIGAKSARCKISSKYTYGNQPVLPIDLAVATGRPETVRLTYEAPAMQWRPGLPSHAAPTFLFHKSWRDLTAPSTERVLYLLKTIIPLRDVNDWMNDNY